MNKSENMEQEFLWELTQLFHKYGYGLDENGYIYLLNKEDPYIDKLKGFTINEDCKLVFEDCVFS